METTTLLECGHPATPHGLDPRTGRHLFPGYGVDRETGSRMCYGCADSLNAHTVASATPGTRWVGYLSNDGRTVQTWSGGVIMARVWLGGFVGTSRERRYVSAVDVDGREWAGTGAPGMYAPMRLTTRKR
jgi:hypothetical protein